MRDTFTLDYFGGDPPYEVGQEIVSPVCDGHGNCIEFAGRAFVSSISKTACGALLAFTLRVDHIFEPPWETARKDKAFWEGFIETGETIGEAIDA